MNCEKYETWIYTYRELIHHQQKELQQHLETCSACKRLFLEVEGFMNAVKGSAQRGHLHNELAEKIMKGISVETKQPGKERLIIPFPNLSASRMTLAAVSCGLLVLFFIEVMVPEMKQGKLKGPITNFQGAIIKSEDFRKAFTKPKEKRSPLEDCKNILTNRVDAGCIKEKLNQINL